MPLYIVIPDHAIITKDSLKFVEEKPIPVGEEVRPGLKVISSERKQVPTGSKMAWWYQVTPSEVVENNQESELLSCPNPHCSDPDSIEIHIDVSGCFVVCNGCGMCGPECAPGDWNTTNDKERKKAAIGLWNDLPRKEFYIEEPMYTYKDLIQDIRDGKYKNGYPKYFEMRGNGVLSFDAVKNNLLEVCRNTRDENNLEGIDRCRLNEDDKLVCAYTEEEIEKVF